MKPFFSILFLSLFIGFSACGQTPKQEFKSLKAAEFKKSIDDKSVVLIDVRTAAEYAEGHIDGAVNIDVNSNDFVAQVKQLKPKKPLAVYCRSGRRSKMAATKLTEAGFRVVELGNGINEWTQAGMPVVK